MLDLAFRGQVDAGHIVSEGVLDVLLDDALQFGADAKVVYSDSPNNASDRSGFIGLHGGVILDCGLLATGEPNRR